jgi:S1-C subfamily serine protease
MARAACQFPSVDEASQLLFRTLGKGMLFGRNDRAVVPPVPSPAEFTQDDPPVGAPAALLRANLGIGEYRTDFSIRLEDHMSGKSILRSAAALLFMLPALVLADKLTLNDGTVIDGTVIPQGERYWVKTADGQSRYVAKTDVKSLVKGSGAPTPSSGSGLPTGPAKQSVGDLATTQRRANSVDMPLAAVTIWQEFIDSKPSPDDLKVANEEMDKWKKLAEGNAEKINGKWVSGEEHEALMNKVRSLTSEAMKDLVDKNALEGEKKLQEARKLYPNSYHVDFLLGYLELLRDNPDKARPYFENVLRLKPKLPEATANLAMIAMRKGQWAGAIKEMDDAAKAGDNKEITYDFVWLISNAPEAVRRSAAVKTAMEDARLLASKYGVSEMETRGKSYYLIPLYEDSAAKHNKGGGFVTGTGFILAADGLILTNKHVAKDAKKYMVLIDEGSGKTMQKSAELVVLDDEQDLALLRIKNPGKSLPIVKLAGTDKPNDGADCTVIGYPLVDRLGGSPKITRGIVSSSGTGSKVLGLSGMTKEIDVYIDAKVNPGNSGGPIIDRFGNVMAIVCMKSLASETEDSYGMGISAGRIRKFLAKNKIDISSGEKAFALSSEEIAAKVEPSTVLIMAQH